MKKSFRIFACNASILTVVIVLTVGISSSQAAVFACHGIRKPNCRGVFAVFGSDRAYAMSGSTAFAEVDVLANVKKLRRVTWRNIAMDGTIGRKTPIQATLDPHRTSTGTVLSIGRREFPAIATMRFYFRIKTQGTVLVSDEPAVFQGRIHSIPPAGGDVLTLVGAVSFRRQNVPRLRMGTLKQSTVSFASGSLR